MKYENEMQKKTNKLLKRTGLLQAWKEAKNDPVSRHELEREAREQDAKRAREEVILIEQDGCFWCKKKNVKSKQRHTLKNGQIICRRCIDRAVEIKEAHSDFKCKCGAYLPLPENINIWTKERDGTWVCISCSHRKKTARIKDIDIEGRIFVPVVRYKLNGHLLFVVRRRASLTIKKIAEYCGWSRQYQRDRLEKANQGSEKDVLTVSLETKNKIENGFVKLTGQTPEKWLKE